MIRLWRCNRRWEWAPGAGRSQTRLSCRNAMLAIVAGTLMPLLTAAAVWGESPAGYVKTDTWFETLFRSRQLLAERERTGSQPRFDGFVSDVVRGGEPARRVSLDVSGLDELFLYVTGAPEVVYGAATWADAKLLDGDGRETLICHMKELAVLDGRHDIDCNLKSGVSGPLSIAGQQYKHGIHVYARSKIRLPLGGKYRRFEAWIGIDDWVAPHGQVRFHVVDGGGGDRLDLWPRLASDFSQEKPRREMKWEWEDRILDADWQPDDFRELATRYARERSHGDTRGQSRGSSRCAFSAGGPATLPSIPHAGCGTPAGQESEPGWPASGDCGPDFDVTVTHIRRARHSLTAWTNCRLRWQTV